MIDIDARTMEMVWGKDCDKKACMSRIENVRSGFERQFGCQPKELFSTSGRTELAGNHTDHNRGLVIAATVTLDTLAAVKKNDDMVVRLISEGFAPSYVDLTEGLEPKEAEIGTSMALVRGVAKALKEKGCRLQGFDAYTQSIVPKASGMSSSACIEVLCGTVFDESQSPLALAQAGQYAENVHYGKPCGLMDQMACAYGGIISIDFKDPLNPIARRVEYDFGSRGYDLVIVNTGGSHADLTSDYAAIPAEMKALAAFYGKKSLRDVEPEELYSSISLARKAMGNDRCILRAIHFFQENDRVRAMSRAIEEDDIASYLRLMKESGHSSFEYLQNIYSPSDPRQQGISLGLALAQRFLGSDGAYRVQGGGFAGTFQAMVPKSRTEAYVRLMEGVFGQGSCINASIRQMPTAKIAFF
ncbi:MAG: galactokinase family protein [Sphaerochaetaceae bacterium]|nr:galactokinase family protein [Sphaerochaetaceae bacterium]